jgi:energy-coupling factor transporter ATP-binding protein EcfA2
MQIMNVDSAEFENIINSCFSGAGIIPVIGAGFSRGSEAYKGKVPDGKNLIDIMLRSLKNAGKIEEEKLKKIKEMDFKSISKYYLNEKYVPRDFFVEDIRNNFTRVNIKGVRRIFLQQPWKYIYTLNIDDGIERANNNLAKVLPYRELDERSQDINLLYKLHGCANEETLYKESTKLIFSESQYIRSLTKNEHILAALQNDILESNLIYLGCSLERELDIMYAVAGVTEDKLIDSKRIYVTKDDLDDIQLDTLEDYGINIVCKLNDYDDIYHLLNERFALSQTKQKNSLQTFQSENINTISPDKNINIQYMLQGESQDKGIKKFFSLPYYSIDRDTVKDIYAGMEQNQVVIIKGRRFSGKTTLLKSISKNVKSKKSYFFPSINTLNIEDIKRMCSIKNSVYFVDSNVITYQEATAIRKGIPELAKNKSNFVIACNPTESDIANTFPATDNENDFFELFNIFSENELTLLNRNLSSLGIIEWRERKNLLENTFNTAEVYPQIKQNIYINKNCSEMEFKCLILLAILDKAFISLTRVIGIGNHEANDITARLSPLLEIIPTSDTESNQKSRYKIVSNSKSWLLHTIKEQFIEFGFDKTKSILVQMIKQLRKNKNNEEIGKKIIMFDTINLLFSRKKGAGRLILKLYEELQPLLSQDPDYWLQRAKAMGTVLKGKKNLLEAIDFAKKAFEDGRRDKTVLNAEFTLANLYGKICEATHYNDKELISNSLYWYDSAIRNNNYNQKYINSMLEVTKWKKGNLYSLCSNIITNNIKLTNEESIMFNNIRRFIAAK